MTAQAAPAGRMVFATPEVEDLYHGQPLAGMRRIELMRLADRNGIDYPDGAIKDDLVPILEGALRSGKIKIGGTKRPTPMGGGLHVPDAAQAEAAVRAQLQESNPFQLRAMLPKEHPMAKKMDAKKAELVDALMDVMAGA